MALPVCDPAVDYVFYEWMPDTTSQGRDTLAELCVGGVREGNWCTRGPVKYRIDQECTTPDNPEGVLGGGSGGQPGTTQPVQVSVALTAEPPPLTQERAEANLTVWVAVLTMLALIWGSKQLMNLFRSGRGET
jgi:hypothetical protein